MLTIKINSVTKNVIFVKLICWHFYAMSGQCKFQLSCCFCFCFDKILGSKMPGTYGDLKEGKAGSK